MAYHFVIVIKGAGDFNTLFSVYWFIISDKDALGQTGGVRHKTTTTTTNKRLT